MCTIRNPGLGTIIGILLCTLFSWPQPALGQSCLKDETPGAVCNSADVTITSITVEEILDGCRFPDDTATVRVTLELQGGAQNRYDVGVYVAEDTGLAENGSCSKDYLPPPLFGTRCNPPGVTTDCYDPLDPNPPFYTAEAVGDTCGDLNGSDPANTFYTLPTPITISCTDRDVNGKIDVSTGTVWSQQASTGAGNKPHCTGVADVLPGTPSKCNLQVINTPFDMPAPSLAIDKTSPTIDFSAVGDIISYNYLVTNTGNNTLPNIVVNDDLVASVSCPDTSGGLAPGDSIACVGTYTVTQADIDAGSVTNTALATDGFTSSAPDSVTVSAVQNPALAIDKSASPGTYNAVGDVISYSYQVSNTGNITLSNITVADDIATDESCPPGALAPGASITCTASHTITQADLDTGSVTNIASATDGVTSSPTDSETVTAIQNAALTLVKVAGPLSYSAVGDVIAYLYEVTNTGNVTLFDITASDDKTTVSCPDTSGGLAPGASVLCQASYTITQADLDAGSVTNTATASDQAGSATSNPDSETVTAVQNPGLTLDKTTTTPTYTAVGNILSFSYLVTNSGNITLSGISVTDDKTIVTCPPGDLAPGASTTCSASYTVTQADLDAGSVTNTATASDQAGSATSNPDSETATAVQNPALSITKTATPATYDQVGDVIGYSYLVTNTGNVTLTNILVADDKATATCPPGDVAPSGSVTCTASYTVTQADLDAGSVTNTATASDQAGTATSPPDSETVDAIATQTLALDKTTTTVSYAAVGDIISYDYAVTNTGNVTLFDITVADDKTTVNCPDTSGGVAPGASVACDASYSVNQADLDAGSVTNTASANSGPATSAPDSVTVNANQTSGLSLSKLAGAPTYSAVGEVISYTYQVTNSGNTTLSNITVTDDTVTVTCPPGDLTPGASTTCTASYTVTQIDLDLGSIVNTATASDGTGTVTSPPDTVTVTAVQTPALGIVKSGTPLTFSAVGETISYSYQVTNTGNVTLANLTVNDDKATVTCPDTSGGLAPGASITCTASYAIVQADLDAGSVTNTATATDGTTSSAPDTATATANQSPAMTIAKSSTESTFSSVGDVLNYSYLVTNTGNVTLSNVTVADDKSTATCPPGDLAPGSSKTCSASYTITQADLDAGSVTNTASASDGTTTSPSDTLTINGQQNPALGIQKTATPTQFDSVGDVISYEYVVTNTGNTTLSNLTVTDDKATVSCPDTSGGLAPAASITCTASFTITQADVDAGSVTNTASVSDGTTSSSDVQETVTSSAVPAVTFDKSVTPATYSTVGETLDYSYLVTNTGGVAFFNIVVNDDQIPSVSCPDTSGGLAPGDSITCTASHTITQADLDAGSITNVASATDGTNTSQPDTETASAIEQPGLGLTKTPSVSTAQVGETIVYTYVVTNTGNVTVNNLVLTDDRLGPISISPTSLAPGATSTETASYTVVSGDLPGPLVNNATVSGDSPLGLPVTSSATASVNLDPTVLPPPVEAVPTLGEWGIMLLFVLLTFFGIGRLYRRQES